MKERSSSSLFWWLAVASTVIALGVHFYLTQHHLDLQYGTSDGSSICNINEKLDCDSVNTSSFSEVMGVPLALWGAITNLFLLLLLLWAKLTNFKDSHLSRLCFLFSGFIALTSVVMFLISITQLNTFCLFCMVAYVTSLTLLLGAAKMTRLDLSDSPETLRYLFRRGEDGGFSYLIFILAIPLCVLLLNGMMRSRYGDDLKGLVQDSLAIWKSNPEFNLDVSTGLQMKDSNGQYRMHVVEFADFGCAHCRHAAPSLHAFAKSRKDVQFTFMNYPLDGNCNPAIKGPGSTCQLAKATICGAQQNRGWEVHDWLFENQGKIEGLGRMITTLGLNEAAFNECLQANATHEIIMKQAGQGQTAGIKGTPTIFVNGRQLPRGQFMPILTEVHRQLN